MKFLYLILIVFQVSLGFSQQKADYTSVIEGYLKTKNPFPEKQNEDIKGKYFVKEIINTQYKSKKAVILTFGYNYTHVSTIYIMCFSSNAEKSEVVGGNGLKKDSQDLKALIGLCSNLDNKTIMALYDIVIENNLPANETKTIIKKDFK